MLHYSPYYSREIKSEIKSLTPIHNLQRSLESVFSLSPLIFLPTKILYSQTMESRNDESLPEMPYFVNRTFLIEPDIIYSSIIVGFSDFMKQYP